MKYIIDKKIRVGYLTAFLLLLLSYILLFFTTNQMFRQTRAINHKDVVISSLEKVESEVKEAESAYRGFLLMKDSAFLDDHNLSLVRIDTNITKTRALLTDNEEQIRNMDTLTAIIRDRMELMRNGSRIFMAGNLKVTDTVRDFTDRAIRRMKDMKRMVNKMQFYENALMENRLEELTAYRTSINTINIASLMIAVLLSVYSLITYARENRSRREADEKTLQYRKQLESRIAELDVANRELTELRQLEKFASTGRIARTIAHEVRNPLTNISLATEQLRDMAAADEENSMLLDMVKRNGDRINQLVSDLLNATKYAELQFSTNSINELVEETLDFARDRIELNGIRTEVNLAPGLKHIIVDKEKIKIALLNIIVNALEAMKPGEGVLSISTTAVNNKCVITIADNGMGMNRESLSKLFEPFFTSKEKGTGLGLTNTQNIILNHKGSIDVTSEPGKGTTFIIKLDFTA
jgi:signal transduction histidine kinase